MVPCVSVSRSDAIKRLIYTGVLILVYVNTPPNVAYPDLQNKTLTQACLLAY